MVWPRSASRAVTTLVVVGGMIGASLPGEVMAAAWSAPEPLAPASLAAPLVVGAVGVVGASTSPAAEGQSQGNAPSGQFQRQSRQSQQQAGPRGDDDDDLDDDPFFADDEPSPALAPSPAPVVEGPTVVEIEVPEGYEVEYEIVEEGAQTAPQRVAPAPAPVPPPVVAQPPAPVPRATSPKSTRSPMTTVELRARRPVVVERYDRQRGEWVVVCRTSCTAEVPRGSLMRVRADRRDDIPASKSFRLPSDRDHLSLDIRPGSREKRAAGIGLAILSATGVITGVAMIRDTALYADRETRTYEGYLVGGMAAITLIAGVAMAVTGKTRVRERATGQRLALLPAGVAF
ncbi:MAG: hypothetical protein H6710_19395 [Myxococcales bacterium]|nr:hypothetical protein [Myxococcales bacterium]